MAVPNRLAVLCAAIVAVLALGAAVAAAAAAGPAVPVTERIFIAESQCLMGEYQVKYSLPWYASGSIGFTSDPPGAAISIRGLRTGEVTPCAIDGIPIGVWEVLLTLDKEKRYLDVTVEPGQTRNYSVVFD